MDSPIVFYTYAHSAPNGKIFYIGKGVEDRAFSFSDRSYDWKKAVKEFGGVQIEILACWDTEEEAFDHEKVLIDCFLGMKYKLANQTKGGKGTYGAVVSDERKKYLSNLLSGYKHKQVTCPKCLKTGGQTSMKRWHFDKCNGDLKYRARVTNNGQRIDLGRFATKEDADNKCIEFYNSINKPLPKEFIRHKGIQL